MTGQTRQDIGLDPANPIVEGSPLTIAVPVYIAGSGALAQLTAFSARWKLFPYEAFGLGDAVLEKEDDDIANNGSSFFVTIERGETTGLRGMHHHELWITQGNDTWPAAIGDFYITASPMAPSLGG
jgi:hypothetical protein